MARKLKSDVIATVRFTIATPEALVEKALARDLKKAVASLILGQAPDSVPKKIEISDLMIE